MRNKMKQDNFISLNRLARELKENKSKLSYYVKMGLLKPITVIGKMQIFDREQTIKIMKYILKQRENKKTLTEIKKNLQHKFTLDEDN